MSCRGGLSYRCDVCKWQGSLEPLDAGDASPCPQCGTFLYPMTWAQTWGATLAIIGLVLASVFAAARYLR